MNFIIDLIVIFFIFIALPMLACGICLFYPKELMKEWFHLYEIKRNRRINAKRRRRGLPT